MTTRKPAVAANPGSAASIRRFILGSRLPVLVDCAGLSLPLIAIWLAGEELKTTLGTSAGWVFYFAAGTSVVFAWAYLWQQRIVLKADALDIGSGLWRYSSVKYVDIEKIVLLGERYPRLQMRLRDGRTLDVARLVRPCHRASFIALQEELSFRVRQRESSAV